MQICGESDYYPCISHDGAKYIAGFDNGVYEQGYHNRSGFDDFDFTRVCTMAADGSNVLISGNSRIARQTSAPTTSPVNTTRGASGYLTVSGDVASIELQYIGNGDFVFTSNKCTIAVF